MKFIDYCDRNRILLAVLPPHSTHTLQPLDVGLFSPLATAYRAVLRDFLFQSQGLAPITKRDFFRLFWQAWCSSFVPDTVKKAFEATGLVPFDPERILKRFRSQPESRRRTSFSAASLSRFSKREEIEQLVNDLQLYPSSNKARRLTKAIVALAAESILLHKENQGLKEAFLNEKKRRQRGKALLLQPPSEYHGGAVFYSPSKVQQARDRQQQKELEEEQQQHQKDEAVKARAEQKRLKEEAADLKRAMRLQAKETKARIGAEKKAEREAAQEAKAVEKQLRIDIQQSKKSKKQSLKPQGKPQAKLPEIQAVEAAMVAHPLPSVSTRSGRKVKLPSKFE